jgi:poly(A) polymerase
MFDEARYYIPTVPLLKQKANTLNAPHGTSGATPALARIIARDAHPISRTKISPEALRVLYRLREAGFQAFLVGGCVRDLILGLEPKDFDVATDALPEQVRALFRNCRLIGRRFRLAHVYFGREIIEVATFRASTAPAQGEEVEELEELDSPESFDPTEAFETSLDNAPAEREFIEHTASEQRVTPDRYITPERDTTRERGDEERLIDESGRILRDNVYGSIDDDIWRRDFTCNALYYNIADFSVWDYCGGFEDVQARRLRLIGDPETRYREDPVRMLRAARFEAKLGFSLEPATAEPIATLQGLLQGVPAARLFDESLKLFLTGHGLKSFETLSARGLLSGLLPNVAEFLQQYPQSAPERLLREGLKNTDERVHAGKSVTPGFLFALLLYGPIGRTIERAPAAKWRDVGTILEAVDLEVRRLQSRVAIHRRFVLGIRDMYALQSRLEQPRGRRALRTLEHPKFRAAFDLFELRGQFGMADERSVAWWRRLQVVSPAERAAMCTAADTGSDRSPSARRRGGRRRPRRGPGVIARGGADGAD